MARTHLRLKNFRPAVVESAQRLFEAKPWREEFGSEAQVQIATAFVNEVCAAYHVPVAEVVISTSAYAPATYTTAVVRVNAMEQIESIAPPKITLARWSITSLLIALREHLLANGAEQVNGDPDAWAHSLFYTVKPAMFRARAREGRIGGVTAKDTFSSATWAQLLEAGVANDYTEGIRCRPNEVRSILEQIASGTFVNVNEDDDTEVAGEEPNVGEWGDEDNLDDELEFDADDDSEVEAVDDNVSESSERPSETAMAEVVAGEVDAAVAALAAMPIVKLRKASRGRVQGGYTLPKDRLASLLVAAGVTAENIEEIVA